MNLEVLLVTMNRNDLSFLEKMNIQSNLVVANQCEGFLKETTTINENNEVKFISTDTRGVGINRNIALQHASAEICLLADDDEVFHDNYRNRVLNEFVKLKDADVLIFNINMIGDKSKTRINNKVKRVNSFNFLNYGAVRIAFKRESIMKKNIWFSTKFGGGAEYSSGEDSLFLKECLDKKLKVYVVPCYIADVFEGNSTWFNGYNDKYFFDKGVFLKAAFPKIYFALALYFSFKFSKISGRTFTDIFRQIQRGIKHFS